VDPTDGRIPPITPEAQTRRAAIREFELALLHATGVCRDPESQCAGRANRIDYEPRSHNRLHRALSAVGVDGSESYSNLVIPTQPGLEAGHFGSNGASALVNAPPSVTLAPTGLTLPLPVVELAWDLEERGFEVTTGEGGTLSVEPR